MYNSYDETELEPFPEGAQMYKALVVVDAQKDFVEGGSLAVAGGLQVAHDIHDLILGSTRAQYKRIIATKDWHNPRGDNGGHFSDAPDFDDTWPAHCVASTTGAEFAGNLHGLLFDDVFHKGWDEPAYDGFQGISARNQLTSLDAYMQAYGLGEFDVVGIATDKCVLATVFTGLKLGYVVNVLADYTVAVGDKEEALATMKAAGANIVRRS